MSKDGIKGIEKLTPDQKKLLIQGNVKHINISGTEYKRSLRAVETWVDEDGIVCARLANGEYYHYYSDGSWG